MSDKLLLSVAGARGIVGKTIDVDVVMRLALAYCSRLGDGPVVVGRDTRPSGDSFKHAAIAAVTAAGRDCIDLGIASTPTVEMAVEQHRAAGGIIVTASHNPVQWNALKFLDHRGIFITKDVSDGLYAAFHSGDFLLADASHTGRVSVNTGAAAAHVEAILGLDLIRPDAIKKRGFKVVLDCINGAGSVIAPALLDALGVETIRINCKDDGDFFRDPEPRPENLAELAGAVKAERADLGFATDPDADRLALVDDTGAAISEEYTLALAVDHVLSHQKGPVVANMSTSAVVDSVGESHATTVERTPVGEAHVVAKMLALKAVIGGEGNGGVIYPTLHPGRDAILGMALILQLLAERGVSLSGQIAKYPPFRITKEKLARAGEFSVEKISGLIEDLKPVRIYSEDGVKAVFDDGWFHLRVSNTEGVVRAIAEGSTEEKSRAHLKNAKAVLEASWA